MVEKQEARRVPAKADDGVLPLAVRQRLWDQLWQRLLEPPELPGDRQDPRDLVTPGVSR